MTTTWPMELIYQNIIITINYNAAETLFPICMEYPKEKGGNSLHATLTKCEMLRLADNIRAAACHIPDTDDQHDPKE